MKINTEKEDKIQKIIELATEKKVSAYKLWQETGVSQPTIGRILKNESKNYNNSTLDLLLNCLNKLGDESNVSSSVIIIPNKNGNTFTELSNGQYLMSMPLIEIEAQAGFLTNYNNLEYLSETAQHSIIVDEVHKGSYVAFRVKGDSMDDNTKNAIANGYIVATRELQRQHWVNKIHFKDFPYWVVYTSKSDYPMLKEIVNHNTENGTVTFHSLNESPEYCDFDLNVNDIQALFYVVDINRNVNNKNYF